MLLLREYEPRNRMLTILLKGASDYTRGKLKQELRRIYHSGGSKEPADQYLDRKIAEATAVLSAIQDKQEAMDMLRGREVNTIPDPPPLNVTPEKPRADLEKKAVQAAMSRDARRKSNKASRLYPEEVERAIQIRSRIANERDKLANSLADLSTNEQRAQVRAQLEQLNDEVQRYHQFVKTWENTKTLPSEKPWQEEDPQEKEVKMAPDEREKLRKKLLSARVNRTKKKKGYQKWIADEESDPWLKKSKVDLYQGEFMKWDRIVRELEEQLGMR